MIVYISTDINSRLLADAEVFVKTYIKWQYDIGNFIKEEYANILSLHPDAIVIDYMAVENPDDLIMMNTAFPDVKLILVVDAEKQTVQPEGWDIVIQDNDAKDNVLNIVYPQLAKPDVDRKIKIGIISDDEDTKINAVFNLLEWFLKYTQDICCIEVSEESESKIPDYEEKFGLVKNENFYEYRQVPVLFNVAKEDVEISIFWFDTGNRKMFEKCDYPMELEDGTLKINGSSFCYPVFTDPINEDRSERYTEIFGDSLGLEIQQEAVKKEPGNNIKETDKEKIRILIKYGILIFILTILFIGIMLILFSCTKTSNKDRNKSAMETTILEETTETSQETTTVEETITAWEDTTDPEETTTRKKKVKKSKTEETVSTKKTETTTSQKAQITTKSQNRSTAAETESVRQKKKTVTEKVTTSEKQTASRKEKVTTTQPFNIEYKVD